jgi:REP element-mobilizing transposase RayT
MARPRKRHVQQELPRHGGKRKGAGRKQVRAIKSAPHRRRPVLRKGIGLHVSLRVTSELARLRRRNAYAAVRRAANVVLARTDFRVIHISIQANHVHLIVEADNKAALATGMKAFEVSAARRLNAAQAGEPGWMKPRKGKVFPDRYHVELLDSPRRARNALAYVLNNWRRHREDRTYATRSWQVDPYSTAAAFFGWREANLTLPRSELDGESPLPVARPETWLLREGWKKYPPVSAFEVPGPKPKSTSVRRLLATYE